MSNIDDDTSVPLGQPALQHSPNPLAYGGSEPPDLLFLARTPTSEAIRNATDRQLHLLLPLLLHHVIQAQTTPRYAALSTALRERLCASRRLKLRFLLLRKHEGFMALSSMLRYSSCAYDNSEHKSRPCAALSASAMATSGTWLPLGEMSSVRHVLSIPVDMVGTPRCTPEPPSQACVADIYPRGRLCFAIH